MAQATADQITAAGGGPAASAPGPGWSESALSGRWIDLESAVSQAGSTPKSPDLAVSSIDRWRYATFFDLRPLGPEEARLIVIGDRHNAAGPHAAYLRIGLFGNPAREKAYLRRLRTTLSELGRVPRPAGSR